jgi:hypothetical protein
MSDLRLELHDKPSRTYLHFLRVCRDSGWSAHGKVEPYRCDELGLQTGSGRLRSKFA